MKVVYKYKLELESSGIASVFSIDSEAQILSVQRQFKDVVLWALVEKNPKFVTRRDFVFVATGQEIPDTVSYLATLQSFGGDIITHVFEVKVK